MKHLKVKDGTKPIMLKKAKFINNDGQIYDFADGSRVYTCEHYATGIAPADFFLNFTKCDLDSPAVGGKAMVFVCKNHCIARMRRASMKVADKE